MSSYLTHMLTILIGWYLMPHFHLYFILKWVEKEGVPLTGLTLPQFKACPNPAPEFLPSCVMVFSMFNDLRWEMIVHLVTNGGNADHHCLNLLFTGIYSDVIKPFPGEWQTDWTGNCYSGEDTMWGNCWSSLFKHSFHRNTCIFKWDQTIYWRVTDWLNRELLFRWGYNVYWFQSTENMESIMFYLVIKKTTYLIQHRLF